MRARILTTIKEKEPIKMVDLAKAVNISPGTTITRYIKELEEAGLIVLLKDSKQRGQPVFLKTTSKADPINSEWLKVINSFKNIFDANHLDDPKPKEEQF